jgi:hypothetical protein
LYLIADGGSLIDELKHVAQLTSTYYMKIVVTDNTLLTFVYLYHEQEVTHKNTLKANYASMSHGTGKFTGIDFVHLNCAVIFFSYVSGKAMLEVQWKYDFLFLSNVTFMFEILV